MSLKQECLAHGMNYNTVQKRMYERGMSREQALTTPLCVKRPPRKPRLHWYLGDWLSTAQLALLRGVTTGSMGNALRKKGLSEAMATPKCPNKSHRKVRA